MSHWERHILNVCIAVYEYIKTCIRNVKKAQAQWSLLTTVIRMGQEQKVLYDLDHGAQLLPLLKIQPHQQLLQPDP